MDFQFSDEQRMVRDLARGIFEKEMTVSRLKAASAQPECFDRALWSTCADAGLLGLVVPERFGGMGYGITEACIFLEEVGRALAPIPALPTLVLGGLAVASYGSEAQQQQWLAP